MTLTLPFDEFAAAVERLTGAKEAYVARHGSGTIATAARPSQGLILTSETAMPIEDVRARLKSAGLTVRDGEFGPDRRESPRLHVAAIAYASAAETPGLWIHAASGPITAQEALRHMYLEFLAGGEIGEADFDEFARAARANILVLSPSDLDDLASRAL